MSSTTLTMIAVIMTATFMVTAFVWQQPQQTQAFRGSESSSPSCVENQPCHTSVTNASTPRSKLTSSPYSASSSKLVPSPASLFAPNSFLPNSSSPHPSSPSSKLTPSPASSSLTLAPPTPSSKLKHHNSDSSAATTSHTSSSNSTESLSNDLSHLFDDIR